MMHKPVLLQEVIKYLDPKPNENFIDATFGLGGHSLEILKHIKPNGKILALEWDPYLVEINKKRFMKNKNIILKNENFKNIKKVVKEENFTQIKGVVFDLGISNWHYRESQRGFSFQKDEFLDMRINPFEIKITAFEIVNYFSKEKIVEILKKYGEERYANKIANEIIRQRRIKKIETTKELAELILRVVSRRKKIHPATKTFMALRTYINNELENLEIGLKEAYDVLDKGGRIVIITFQGLEDKVVKKVFKEFKNKGAKLLTKNVVRPSQKEILENPSARSAKLRAILKNDKEEK
jgi:16S rRNA (cytosine1402-N4)-methyltransferase